MKIKLEFNVTFFHKNGKNARLGLDTAYKDGLYPKFEEKPVNGLNKDCNKKIRDPAISLFIN